MNKLFTKVLETNAFKLLQHISVNPEFVDFYLVGGTALALQLGHRKSIDLDLFAAKEFNASIIQNIQDKYSVISLHNNSIELEINNTKLFFFYFAFPLYKDLIIIDNVRLAHPIDIGLMKLLALQGRSTRKDIIDLYFIDKKIISLEKLLNIFEHHYPKESFNSYDSLKSLFDIEALQIQPMPKMLKVVNWEKCLDLVSKKISAHIKNTLN